MKVYINKEQLNKPIHFEHEDFVPRCVDKEWLLEMTEEIKGFGCVTVYANGEKIADKYEEVVKFLNTLEDKYLLIDYEDRETGELRFPNKIPGSTKSFWVGKDIEWERTGIRVVFEEDFDFFLGVYLYKVIEETQK